MTKPDETKPTDDSIQPTPLLVGKGAIASISETDRAANKQNQNNQNQAGNHTSSLASKIDTSLEAKAGNAPSEKQQEPQETSEAKPVTKSLEADIQELEQPAPQADSLQTISETEATAAKAGIKVKAEPVIKAEKKVKEGHKKIRNQTKRELDKPTDISLVCTKMAKHYQLEDKETKSLKRLYQLLVVFVLVGLFLLVMAYQTVFGGLNQPANDMVVEEGESYYGLLPQFQKDVPMFSANLAKLYVKASVDAPLQAGTYSVPKNPSLRQLLVALQEKQKVDMVVVQIIEGKTAADLYHTLAHTEGVTLEVLDAQGKPKPDFKSILGIAATTPEGEFSHNLEGWFSPNTYHYAHGATDKQILTDLYQSQQTALDEAWANRAEGLPYKTPYEALIMASIIEKETSVASERGLVSAVFVNRLQQGMRLQTDPTIIYGMGTRYDGNIRRKDIDEKTAYNTYQIDGLPPTPIALPSHESITAAMHPADSDALYFVATGTGGHKFSKTLAEHNQAVQDYLKVIRSQKTQGAQ